MIDPFPFIVVGIPTFIITVWVAHFLGWSSGCKLREKEAIKRGFAQYNSETGDWEWKRGATP